MTDRIITVPQISVKVVTGKTCYPGENGFSVIYAEVTPQDDKLQRQLSQAQQSKLTVTLRCAMLDVTGRINRVQEGAPDVFVLSIDELDYRKPQPT